jgi:hypothetical protein
VANGVFVGLGIGLGALVGVGLGALVGVGLALGVGVALGEGNGAAHAASTRTAANTASFTGSAPDYRPVTFP